MKKIFCIISAVIIGCVGSFMVVLGAMRSTVATFDSPVSINVYYRGTTPINGEEYHKEDKNYDKVMKYLKSTLTSSYLTTMIHDGTVYNKPVYGKTNYARYDTSMKSNNLAVELIFAEERNIVCVDGDNERVVAFAAMIIIIPLNSKYEEMICYTSTINDSNNKDGEYSLSTPFILKGNPKKLIKFAKSFGN